MLQNTFILRRPRVDNFADIIKIATMFIKTTFKGSKRVKRIRNYALKCNLYLYFLIKQRLLISGEKMLILAELKWCIKWFMCCLDLSWVKYNCVKFHQWRICVTDFREGDLFAPSIREQPRKGPSRIGLKLNMRWERDFDEETRKKDFREPYSFLLVNKLYIL